jgi:hypothetical protein
MYFNHISFFSGEGRMDLLLFNPSRTPRRADVAQQTFSVQKLHFIASPSAFLDVQ